MAHVSFILTIVTRKCYNEARISLQWEMETMRQIICLGDSVTRGISFVRGRMRIMKENYPALLQGSVGSWAVVLNRGVFNDNSDGLVERLSSDVLAAHPDIVLIEIGGNDCNFHWDEVAKRPDETHESIVPLERYVDNIRALAARIREGGAQPVFMNILPLDPVRYYRHIYSAYGKSIAHWIALCGGIAYWHDMYNQNLVRLLSSMGVKMIQVREEFEQSGNPAELISDDGIHPTVSGYRLMSQVVADQLAAFI